MLREAQLSNPAVAQPELQRLKNATQGPLLHGSSCAFERGTISEQGCTTATPQRTLTSPMQGDLQRSKGFLRKLRTKIKISNQMTFKNKKQRDSGAGEMLQLLRTLTALPQFLSSIPSYHIIAYNHL